MSANTIKKVGTSCAAGLLFAAAGSALAQTAPPAIDRTVLPIQETAAAAAGS